MPIFFEFAAFGGCSRNFLSTTAQPSNPMNKYFGRIPAGEYDPNGGVQAQAQHRPVIRTFALMALFGLSANLASAGSVFVTGHDPDFHAQAGPNQAGAQHVIQLGLNFVRDGNTAPILLLESNTSNIGLGDHLDSELGLIDSGYSAGNTPGNHYVKVNATDFATIDLSLFSAIFVPSDHGGTLTGDDLQALDARTADILDYVNGGGGLMALAEDGFHTPPSSGPAPALFGFLPFLATSAPLGEFENGNTDTAFGTSLGLLNSDVNGNFSHNVFTSTGGMSVVDVDATGEILSLATRQTITRSGVPDASETAVLLAAGLAVIVAIRGRRASSRT
jgi:hypothetical protein